MNAIILPYKNGSRSGAALANALGVRQIRLSGSTINRQRGKSIINWGNSGRNLPPQGLGRHHTLINSLEAVSAAANKLNTFNLLYGADVRIPEYTTDFLIACEWLEEGSKVVERHQLTGHSGAGINIVEELDDLSSQVPLYVKYIKKQDEYRVHIMGGQVIDVQRKARRSDVPDEDVNWQVRNHQNGFCYMRENVNPDTDVIVQALDAIEALGLDFGAVDVIWNRYQGKAYVLEVNTACGLEGTTLERYKVAFQELLMTGEVTPLEGYEYSEEEVEDEEPLDVAFASDETYALDAGEDTQTTSDNNPEFRLGDRVRIASSSQYYGRTWSSSNPSDVTGTVHAVRNGLALPVMVMWDNGGSNIYNFHDLELSDETIVQEEQADVEEIGYSSSYPRYENPTYPVGTLVEVTESGHTYPTLPWGQTTGNSSVDGTQGTVVGTTNVREREVVAIQTSSGDIYALYIRGVRRINSHAFDTVTPSRPSPSPQATPAPLSKWLVAVDGSVNLEEGVFDTQEEAEMAIVSPDFHNMRQLGHDVRVVSL